MKRLRLIQIILQEPSLPAATESIQDSSPPDDDQPALAQLHLPVSGYLVLQ